MDSAPLIGDFGHEVADRAGIGGVEPGQRQLVLGGVELLFEFCGLLGQEIGDGEAVVAADQPFDQGGSQAAGATGEHNRFLH
jgi:hypothetical protein